MLRSYMMGRISECAPDIDAVPVRVLLGGTDLSLVVTDEENVPLLCDRGFFVVQAFPGPVSCGKRMFLVPGSGGLPVEVEHSEQPIWCLDDPLPDI
jgi:hypothetical protein